MSDLDFSGLGDLAKQSPEKAAKGWQPLTLDDLGYGTVLAFDQSLTATGAVLANRGLGGIQVFQAQQLTNLQAGRKQGVETWLLQGVDVFSRARPLIRFAKDHGYSVAHESPPNPGAVKGAGISSLLAAQALRCAAWDLDVPIEMLGAQPAKKLVCGNGTADKKTAHAELKLSVLPWIVNSQVITNEALRDALLIALLWLHRRKQ